jgi:hypothetical protein
MRMCLSMALTQKLMLMCPVCDQDVGEGDWLRWNVLDLNRWIKTKEQLVGYLVSLGLCPHCGFSLITLPEPPMRKEIMDRHHEWEKRMEEEGEEEEEWVEEWVDDDGEEEEEMSEEKRKAIAMFQVLHELNERTNDYFDGKLKLSKEEEREMWGHIYPGFFDDQNGGEK